MKIEAYNEKLKREKTNIHELASLIVVGMKDPEHFPSLEEFAGIEEDEEQNWQELAEDCQRRGLLLPD
ncbi:MAG: hypothetical protein ACE14P_14085 [Methanotrichaceae archaeon]